MPAAEIMHKFYHHEPMSNGRMISSLAQAKAIASQYGKEGDEDEEKKKNAVSREQIARLASMKTRSK